MSKKAAFQNLNWGEKLDLVKHYSLSDADAVKLFEVSLDELTTAKQLSRTGLFSVRPNFTPADYQHFFDRGNSEAQPMLPAPTNIANTSECNKESQALVQPETRKTATSHVIREQSDTVTAPSTYKKPGKRGRKGDKITKALKAVPRDPVPVNEFITEHGVSLAVLRQAKRFVSKMDPVEAQSIGIVRVKQDRQTKQLMIWREPASTENNAGEEVTYDHNA